MKKIFTLALGLVLTTAILAADRRPTVTITTSRNYEVVIDGNHYMSNGNTISISNLFNGKHDVKVFEKRPGFFMRSKKLVASSSFQLRNGDVQITIDRFGQPQITESRFGRGGWNDRDNDRYGDSRHDRDNHDRRF